MKKWNMARRKAFSKQMKVIWKKKQATKEQIALGDVESMFEKAGRKWHYCPNCGFELREEK